MTEQQMNVFYLIETMWFISHQGDPVKDKLAAPLNLP